jgi:hypothetical protein
MDRLSGACDPGTQGPLIAMVARTHATKYFPFMTSLRIHQAQHLLAIEIRRSIRLKIEA